MCSEFNLVYLEHFPPLPFHPAIALTVGQVPFSYFFLPPLWWMSGLFPCCSEWWWKEVERHQGLYVYIHGRLWKKEVKWRLLWLQDLLQAWALSGHSCMWPVALDWTAGLLTVGCVWKCCAQVPPSIFKVPPSIFRVGTHPFLSPSILLSGLWICWKEPILTLRFKATPSDWGHGLEGFRSFWTCKTQLPYEPQATHTDFIYLGNILVSYLTYWHLSFPVLLDWSNPN